MAKFPLTNVGVTIGGLDVSNYVRNLQPELIADKIDVTPWANPTGYKEYIHGQATARITFDMFCGNTPFEIMLRAAYDNDSTLNTQIIPKNTSVSSANPIFNFDCWVQSYAYLTDSIGNPALATIVLESVDDPTWGTILGSHMILSPTTLLGGGTL